MRELPLRDSDIDRRGPPPKIVRRLNERPDFSRAVNRLVPPADITAALGELAEIGVRLYLHGAASHPLVLLHAVTNPAAVQRLIKHASPQLRSIAFAYGQSPPGPPLSAANQRANGSKRVQRLGTRSSICLSKAATITRPNLPKPAAVLTNSIHPRASPSGR